MNDAQKNQMAKLLREANKPNQSQPDGYKQKLMMSMLNKEIHDKQNPSASAYAKAIKADEMQ